MAGRGPSPKALAAEREAQERAAAAAGSGPFSAPAPNGLKATGRRVWAAVCAAVAPGWDLDEADLLVLEQACRLADAQLELERAIRKHGTMTVGSTGQLVVNPAVAELRQSRAAMARLVRQIELAPPKARTGHLSARQRNVLRDLRVVS